MATKKTNTKKKTKVREEEQSLLKSEALIIGFFLLAVLLFLSNFGLIGVVGKALKSVQLGLFGALGYIFPVLLFLTAVFCISNKDNPKVWIKLAALFTAVISLAGMIHIFFGQKADEILGVYGRLYTEQKAGGFLGGIVDVALESLVGKVGTFFILLAILILSCVVITERSFVRAIKSGSGRVYDRAKEDVHRGYERHQIRSEARQIAKEEAWLRKVQGVDLAATDLSVSSTTAQTPVQTSVPADPVIEASERELAQAVAEITNRQNPDVFSGNISMPQSYDYDDESVPFDDDIKIPSRIEEYNYPEESEPELGRNITTASGKVIKSDADQAHEDMLKAQEETDVGQVKAQVAKARKKAKAYKVPPMNLLERGDKTNGTGSGEDIKNTAITLQQTLASFGIGVTVTDVSCGPTVTRYELHPDVGVKVNQILSLQDNIKMALAAVDIRIEAPIPGKAAIGIEVPNKENATVRFRDLIDNREYKDSKAKIAFAIGKDIGGKTVMTDVAKMPHLLIAGATGSGKSVCINTLIMSILYKYSPDDVKMIMIDPKVVELSVYNGIPHLLIPVVTDVRKAAGALNWAVSEMEDRYKKFEQTGVRDIESYNERIEQAKNAMLDEGADPEEIPEKLPLIVIIIDELADLMVQAKAEVETAIVRISQLARAAGIHLVIATQRPSVNVITGLIKANIPSRIAFAVTSGVDSRTILDGYGAEKLLGKGDMLYNPQGAPKPIRVQGAFVSDEEIARAIEYIKNEDIAVSYDEESISKMTGSSAGGTSEGDRDELFAQAGRFIINKDKASIGKLQIAFRIGFNRASRIMEQLYDAGVVGPEQGTKPREVLMSEEQFEEIL